MDTGKKAFKKVYQKKKTVKKNEKLNKQGKENKEEIASKLKKVVDDFAESRMEKYHVESPSVEIPVNHFRNIAHRLRYDEVDKFTLKPAKTFDWENLSQNPIYASLHDKFIKMNWMGIVHVNEKQVSESAVKEFYTGILTDSKGKDL
ncbi:vacuolar protein sorting-associated protein 54 [Corchorus olitorius]|uniref:Vacuolar protein sorting-associated protein 54 n=1 Tax=Corchorus olitorius TaxID=93759 RepID=A0A1R3HQX3_9ROSI|nr:vacuolar protein sorting-associated protein 54 [Corchorus olitorius]